VFRLDCTSRSRISPSLSTARHRYMRRPCLDSGWELNAHSYDQQPMHKVENQREVIERSLDIIEEFSGVRPRGWFGPGLTQTFDTLDILSECGVEYVGDWACDDEPVTLKTRFKDIVALPYNFELHDIVMMALQHNVSAEMFSRSLPTTTAWSEKRRSAPRSCRLPSTAICLGRPTGSLMPREHTRRCSRSQVCCAGMERRSSIGI
jgi:allantoinase